MFPFNTVGLLRYKRCQRFKRWQRFCYTLVCWQNSIVQKLRDTLITWANQSLLYNAQLQRLTVPYNNPTKV